MATRTKSVDEIVARIESRRALMNPHLRGMWAIQAGAALAFAAVLLADYFEVALPFSLDFLSGAGSPLRVLLVVALAVEGLLVAQRFALHKEPGYPVIAQGGGVALASSGGVAAGAGLVVRLSWDALFASYYPQALWVEPFAATLMLCGAGLLLASLPPLAGSALRQFAAHPSE